MADLNHLTISVRYYRALFFIIDLTQTYSQFDSLFVEYLVATTALELASIMVMRSLIFWNSTSSYC